MAMPTPQQVDLQFYDQQRAEQSGASIEKSIVVAAKAAELRTHLAELEDCLQQLAARIDEAYKMRDRTYRQLAALSEKYGISMCGCTDTYTCDQGR